MLTISTPCENEPDLDSQPAVVQFVKLKSKRHSGGFLIHIKSYDKVAIMLDLRAKAASIKPRRSSGVRGLHDSRASGRVNSLGSPQSAQQRSPMDFSELKAEGLGLIIYVESKNSGGARWRTACQGEKRAGAAALRHY